MLDDGPRYLCSAACGDAFRRGHRPHESKPPPPARVRSVPERVRDATRPSIDLSAISAESSAIGRLVAATPPTPFPALGLGAAALAFVLATLGAALPAAVASVGMTAVAAGLALAQGRSIRREVGVIPWLVGPLGAVLAAIAGLAARLDDPARWLPLAGGAVAAAAMLVRSWLDARANEPVAALVARLLAPLPRRLRVPAEVAEGDVRYEEVPASRVRTGEEILVVEGEVVGVDALVDGGEAWILPHAGAQAPIRRRPGDPVLAGARITEGALRLLVTRVGAERALARVGRFGAASPARIVRIAARIVRWGGVLALVASASGLALAGDPGVAGSLSAAAAVLIAAPLLSARRAAEAPLVAAAAAGASRGIVYRDGRALEDAGRVGTVAIATSGTVTEGRPELIEVHVLGGGDEDALVADAAAAEAAVEAHPIGGAIRRYAKQHRLAVGAVRRAQLEPGRGVTATTSRGDALVLGNRQLLLDHGVSIAVADAEATRAEDRGMTALFLGLAGRVRAVLVLRDEVRVGSRAAVQRFFDQRLVVVLMSGDHRGTAEAIGRQLDVALVKAELPPDERGEEVKRLAVASGVVAAIGRLGDDDAILRAADLPVVLDAAGSPQVDRGVTLATDDLRDAAAALWIAQAARAESLRGVFLAVGLGAPALFGAAFGWIPPAAAALVAVTLDAIVLPAGMRLLRRIELRVPTR